jgi:pilus assembly protein Flp/PilA
MKTLSSLLKAFWQEESGLTIVEYAVAGGLISGAAVLAFTALGVRVTGL